MLSQDASIGLHEYMMSRWSGVSFSLWLPSHWRCVMFQGSPTGLLPFSFFPFVFLHCLLQSEFTQKISNPKLYWYCSPPVRGAGFSGKKLVEGMEGSDSSTVLYIPPIALSSLGNWLNRPVFEFWPEVSIPVWRWSCTVSFLSCNFSHEYFIPAPFP